MNFSSSKYLYKYQQHALKNAIKVLWKYYQEFYDFNGYEEFDDVIKRKQSLYQCYIDNGSDQNFDLKLKPKEKRINKLLEEHYPNDGKNIKYELFNNRMSFWMATGSGKTLIIIKLIQIIKTLIERKEIPDYDILFLTHRDDLLEQFKVLVKEFNYSNNRINIVLKDLKEYPELKRQKLLSREEDIIIFYYRSNNISDVQKEKIIDYRNYYNDGKWYIFLDEAHKGDREESIRQHIYSIFSKNGFLFNFSATFVDDRDFLTCALEFNLSSFISSGYGKHINILKQEIREFRKKEDFTSEEKQAIVLKSLIILTYVKMFYSQIVNFQSDLYHSPLLLILVKTVNVKDADLKLFFRELVEIGKGNISKAVLKKSIDDLLFEFNDNSNYLFEYDKSFNLDEKILNNITFHEILKNVFNSETPGEIEVVKNASNKKELAFKLKTSEKPFSLIKIGDITDWLKIELIGYEIQDKFKDEGYFMNLNRQDSEINILMGAQSFYEGWDSNRPNVINFINIGIGNEAQKFILQSIGRGVRIEPVKDKRKRLINLYNAKEIPNEKLDRMIFHNIKEFVKPLETLFIIATNRKVIYRVVEELDLIKKKAEWIKIGNIEINRELVKKNLFIPNYMLSSKFSIKDKEFIKFEISKVELDMIQNYFQSIPDNRILLMRYDTTPKIVEYARDLVERSKNFKIRGDSIRNIELLVQRIFSFYDIKPKIFEKFIKLEDEIRHYEYITVNFKDITKLTKSIEKMKIYPVEIKELNESYYQKISPEEFIKKVRDITNKVEFKRNNQKIVIKYFENHFYNPIIFTENEVVDYIRHIIKVRSEINFIKDLEEYLSTSDNKFNLFDWWFFSKIDETLDDVYIPYYDTNSNKIRQFYPDFIFWLKKNDDYYIFFIDPKGIEHINWADKVNGYKKIFEENNKRIIVEQEGLNFTVLLMLRTDDANRVKLKFPNHSKYWFDEISTMFEFLK